MFPFLRDPSLLRTLRFRFNVNEDLQSCTVAQDVDSVKP
jgi:hypothetical protein